MSLVVGVLTLYSMTKIWGATFWGEEKESDGRAGRMEIATTGVVLVLSLAGRRDPWTAE